MSSLLQENDGIVSYEISVDGSVLSGEIEIISIRTTMEVNRITSATIKISDGGSFGLEKAPFSNSSSNDFVPGNEIEIKLGYNSSDDTVFSGVIVGQRMVVRKSTSYLLITCKDKSFKLTKSRGNNVMVDSTDDSLFEQLISDVGLEIESDSASQFNSPLFQYNVSDWDYLVIRAEANNLFVFTDQNKVNVKKYDLSSSPSYKIQSDLIAIDVDLDLNGEQTYSDFNFTSWDHSKQQSVVESGSMNDSGSLGNLKSNSLAGNLSVPTLQKYTSAPLSSDELKAFSDSWTTKSSLSKIQGRIIIPGTAKLKAGDLVELANFGDRFDGNAFISKIEQECEDGNWLTVVYVGLSSRWHSSLPDIEEEDGIGLLPGGKGTYLAKVKQINDDPNTEYRVLVDLGVFQNSSSSNELWARFATNYATSDAGFFFFPEVDDEVLITFLNGDPRFPVIIGSLYSSQLKPKVEPDADNSTKAIHSKSGIAFTFNETDKILTIETPGGNSVVLDDKDQQIVLTDSNSNKVTMDGSGIALSSPFDISIKADGKVDISGTSGINLSSSAGDVTGDGMNVTLEAQVGMKAAGNATAELSASGQTTVKGAMVMIN